MILLPVMARELGSAARHSFTYYLRTLAVAVLLLVSLTFAAGDGLGAEQGAGLFCTLHLTLFAGIWILVPVLTADCLSQERREGTLGLLFLTGLRAGDIVVAKSFTQGLRAWTLWLAVLPVLTVPLLLGGVSWKAVALSALVNFSAICWALAAGLLASAWSKRWLRSLLKAVILAALFLGLLAFGAGCSSLVLVKGLSGAGWMPDPWDADEFLEAAATQLGLITERATSFYFSPYAASPAIASHLLVGIAVVSAASLLALGLAILLAGIKTRRVWHEEPPYARQLWWQKTFLTPVLLDAFYHRWLRRRLERNPIGWLEQRMWSGRLVTWGWLAVVVALYSAILSDQNFVRGYAGLQHVMAWLMAGSIVMTAAGSFRRERETGVMELLLVSPMSEGDIIWGRLRGLWGQFLPAIALLLGVWIYFSSFLPDVRDPPAILFYASTFLTAPVVGLYFSLRCVNFLTAFLAAVVVDLLLPLLLPPFLSWMWWLCTTPGGYFSGGDNRSGSASVCQLVIAGVCWGQLHRRLRQRAFTWEKAEK